MGKSLRSLIVGALALASLLALPAAAGAVLPGPNGKLLFTSGRGGPAGNDDQAKIYTYKFPGGPAVQVTTASGRHSHPNWSPDRTMIAYTLGPAASDKDIWIHNLVSGLPVNITNSPNVNEDNPAFSPDGTRIAYTSELSDGSNQSEILIRTLANGSVVNLTSSVNVREEKPVWTPDSATIFYSFGDVGANGADIYKEASNNSQVIPTPVLTNNTYNEWQPALSPDGSRLCYTRGPRSSAAQVWTVAATGIGAQTNLSNSANGGINCVFSPDGSKIAYTRGVFTQGELGYKNANNTGLFVPLTDSDNHFDGNADWAPNPGPTCQGTAVTVAFNGFVSIPLACTDPAPENDPTSKSIVSGPSAGNLGAVKQGNPATVIYTPNVNFSGTDSFTFRGNDGTSSSAPATVNINVARPGQGGGNADDTRAAVISNVRVVPRVWRRGSLLPRFSLAPRGTRIRFTIDEMAAVTLSFAKTLPGRRVGRRCVAPTRANRNRRRCTRFVNKGVIRRVFNAGTSRVRFQGRINRRRRLGLGRHRVTVGARDAAGNPSRPRSAFFTIVRR